MRLFAERGIPLLARFTHVGHNIGLETEEEWLVSDHLRDNPQGHGDQHRTLLARTRRASMIGDEETYLIDADGPERISVLPREIYRVD